MTIGTMEDGGDKAVTIAVMIETDPEEMTDL